MEQWWGFRLVIVGSLSLYVKGAWWLRFVILWLSDHLLFIQSSVSSLCQECHIVWPQTYCVGISCPITHLPATFCNSKILNSAVLNDPHAFFSGFVATAPLAASISLFLHYFLPSTSLYTCYQCIFLTFIIIFIFFLTPSFCLILSVFFYFTLLLDFPVRSDLGWIFCSSPPVVIWVWGKLAEPKASLYKWLSVAIMVLLSGGTAGHPSFLKENASWCANESKTNSVLIERRFLLVRDWEKRRTLKSFLAFPLILWSLCLLWKYNITFWHGYVVEINMISEEDGEYQASGLLLSLKVNCNIMVL